MDSYVALNGSRFMVTWTTFESHLLEVGLTQNQETMALWTLITIDFFYFIMCEVCKESMTLGVPLSLHKDFRPTPYVK